MKYKEQTAENGYFVRNRSSQAVYWMHETINEKLRNDFYSNPKVEKKIASIEKMVKAGKINPFMAADNLLSQHKKLFKNK